MFKYTLILFLVFSPAVQAKLAFELSNNYTSDEDDASNFSFSKLDSRVFLGASLDKQHKIFFGQSLMMTSRSLKPSGRGEEDTVSVTELGPRFSYYSGEGKGGALFSLAWNPYAKGDRKVAGVQEDISGWSYFLSVGYLIKLSKNVFLGATYNYHVLNVTKSTDTANLETELSQTYTTIYPMLEVSFRI